MDSNCQNGQNRRNAIWGIFYCEKRQKAVKNKVFEKIIAVGSVLVSMKKFEDKCIGCSACSRQCPVGAISGEIKKKFEIDQEKCIRCGKCFNTCRFGAIVKE